MGIGSGEKEREWEAVVGKKCSGCGMEGAPLNVGVNLVLGVDRQICWPQRSSSSELLQWRMFLPYMAVYGQPTETRFTSIWFEQGRESQRTKLWSVLNLLRVENELLQHA